MPVSIYSIAAGILLDIFFGDPHWLPHPVRWMGSGIALLERLLRKWTAGSAKKELVAGAFLAVVMAGVSAVFCWAVLFFAGWAHPAFRFVLESLMCWQALAARELHRESMRVCHALEAGDLVDARKKLAMIVGRETEQLDAGAIAKAAVETVAENTSDGVVAPLLYLFIGGAPLAFMYKAVNTLDSVVGYRNEAYLYFGRASARLDDLLNLIPARLSALLMIPAAGICRLNMQGAARIWRRDRYNHKSPNSAQTEAVCAGALGIRLGGDAVYHGKLVQKPTIGDARRAICSADIRTANQLMYATSGLAVLLLAAVKLAVTSAL